MANDSTATNISGSDLRDQFRQNMYSGRGSFNPTLTRRPAAGPAINNPAAWAAGTQQADGTPTAAASAPNTSILDNLRTGAAAGTNTPSFAAIQSGANDAAQAAATQARTGGSATFDPKAPALTRNLTTGIPLGGFMDNPLIADSPTGIVSGTTPIVPATSAPATASAVPPGAPGKLAGVLSATLPGGLMTPATSSTPAVGDGALSQSGKPIGFGKMVNGIATFSDGSGGPGAVPRTMSDAQITGLNKTAANTNVIPSQNFVAPAPGVAASEATGGAVTPALGSFSPTLSRTLPDNGSSSVADAIRDAESNREQAEDLASSHAIDIANEDPRSPWGVAARNLRVSLGGMKAARTRFSVGASPYESAIANLYRAAGASVPGANSAAGRATQLAEVGINQQGQNQRELERDNAAASAATLNRNRTIYQTDPVTGRVSQVSGTTATPVTDASGKPYTVTPSPKDLFDTKSIAAYLQNGGDVSQLSPAARARIGLNTQSVRPTATMKDGSKVTLSADGKTWVPLNG